MKKLLILWAAFLALVPNLKSQTTVTVDLFNYNYTSTIGTAASSSSISSKGHFSACGKLVGNTTAKGTTVQSAYAFQYGYGNDDKVQLLDEKGEAAFSMLQKTTSPKDPYLMIKCGTGEARTIIFRALYGTISKITLISTSPKTNASGVTYPNNIRLWTTEDEGVTINGPGTTGTITATGGKREIRVKVPAQSSAASAYCFYNISVEYTPGTPSVPDPVSNMRFTNGEFNEATNTFSFRNPATAGVYFGLSDRAEMILATPGAVSSDVLNVSNGTLTSTNVIYANNTNPITFSTTKWSVMPSYRYAPTTLEGLFGNSVAPDANTTKPLKVVAWNGAGPSEEKTINLKFIPLDALEVDVDQLPEGMAYDAESKLITYTRFTPETAIPLKLPEGANRIYYVDSKTAPSSANSPTGTKSLNAPDDGETTIWLPIEYDVAPVHYQQKYISVTPAIYTLTQSRIIYGPESSRLTLLCRFVGGEEGAVPAPDITVKPGSNVLESAGGMVSFIGNNMAFEVSSNNGNTTEPRFQYQFREPDANGAWVQKPSEAEWEDLSAGLNNTVSVFKSGRLFVREKVNGEANYSYRDIQKIETTQYSTLAALKADAGEEEIVTITGPLRIMGAYRTEVNGQDGTTRYVYVVDRDGTAIKLVAELAGDGYAFPESYYDFKGKTLVIPGGGVTGVFRGRESGFNEIWVTTPTMKYLSFLSEAHENEGFGDIPEYERTEVTAADFNRLITVRGMTWLNESGNALRDAAGNIIPLYARLKGTDPSFADIIAAFGGEDGKGKQFSVTGFVGQASGQLALFPIELPKPCPSTPVLLAPNPISTSDDNIDDHGYILANAISDAVTLDVEDAADSSDDITYYISITLSPDDTDHPVEMKENGIKGRFTVDLMSGDAKYVKVWAKMGSLMSVTPAMVKFNKIQAREIGSIVAFKTLEFGEGDQTKRATHYKMTGNAIVEKRTQYFLYVRDYSDAATAATGSDVDNKYRYLLIYNANTWTNPIINDEKTREKRSLEPGDVITGFALVPRPDNTADGIDESLKANLISYSTGFARTFRFVNTVPEEETPVAKVQKVDYDDAAQTDHYYTNITVGEADRMSLVKLEGVRVLPRENNPDAAPDAADDTRWIYTLNIGDPATNPVRLTFDIFPNTQGWHAMYRADTPFNITGVVVRVDKNGTTSYALAPTNIEAAESLDGALQVYLEETPDDKRANEVQDFISGTVVMNYPDDADAVIYYTLDGTDPRNNPAGRAVWNPAEPLTLADRSMQIRAFAAKPGANPTPTVSRTFRKQTTDVQFILNFLATAEQGKPYRFTERVKIVAAAGEYMFVAGSVGHFLPIYMGTAWNPADYPAGSYIEKFNVTYRVDDSGNRMGDATAFAATYPAAIPAEDMAPDRRFDIKADSVTAISAANARRLVKIHNVSLHKSGDGEAALWTVRQSTGREEYPLAFTLGKPDALPESPVVGNLWNMTGFVMLGADGEAQLWPVALEEVEQAEPVTVRVIDAEGGPAADEPLRWQGTFYPVATVTLSYPQSPRAVIYYTVGDETVDPDAQWYVYGLPITVVGDIHIHAYAEVPGRQRSEYIHIDLTRAPESTKISGRLRFSSETLPGKVLVTIEPEEDLAPGYSIYYTTKEGVTLTPETGELYTGPVEITETSWLMAILVEAGKAAGEVCYTNVFVLPDVTAIEDIDADGNITVRGSDIIAPQGSRIFDISGRPVKSTGLAPGIYIVRTPDGKSLKVKI